jgi:hypothetical protein
MMAYFKAIGKLIDSCGITNIMVNADIIIYWRVAQ